MRPYNTLWIVYTLSALFLHISCTRANGNCSQQSFSGFGFELLIAKLDYLQHQLDGIGHNITMLQNISASVHAKQSACTNLEKIAVSTEKPTADQETLRSGPFRSCREEPTKQSGKYLLQAGNAKQSFEGVCEQTLFGGGWLVIQRRFDGTVDFYRNWDEYRKGFGDIDREFWIGLERIHQLTSSKPHQLLIELTDFFGDITYAQYSAFEIGSESEQYSLKQLGSHNGTADDALRVHAGLKFITMDRETREHGYNRAEAYGGAWWYADGYLSNLNGLYTKVGNDARAMRWYKIGKPHMLGLAASRMMIRPS